MDSGEALCSKGMQAVPPPHVRDYCVIFLRQMHSVYVYSKLRRPSARRTRHACHGDARDA